MVWGDLFFVVCNRYFLSAVGKGRWYSSSSLSYRRRWARLQNESLLFWFSGWRRPVQELFRNSYEYPLSPGGRLVLYAHLIQPILLTFLRLMISKKRRSFDLFLIVGWKPWLLKMSLWMTCISTDFSLQTKKFRIYVTKHSIYQWLKSIAVNHPFFVSQSLSEYHSFILKRIICKIFPVNQEKIIISWTWVNDNVL